MMKFRAIGTAGILFLLYLGTGSASAEVRVVATLEDLGWIAAQVGGDEVAVEVLCPGNRDPHVLPAKPSLARKMKKADLLIYNGLELEVGWLPLLMDAARNPRIRPGQPGELDCSLALGEGDVLGIPSGEVDRSHGDIHPLGNPHYLLDPRKGAQVGRLIAERLGRIDPGSAELYLHRADHLAAEIDRLRADWERRMAALPVRKVIVYHQQWEYLAEWLDLDIIGVIENRPGISPSPRHLEGLIDLGREQEPVIVMAATWDHVDGAAVLAGRIDAPLVVLPASSSPGEQAEGYLDLMESICGALERAGGGS